jgi:hypothetical protein
MGDDSLRLLTSFRDHVADADETTAERIYQRATAMAARRRRPSLPGRLSPVRLSDRQRLRRLALALALAGLIVVPAAVAVAAKVIDLFEGTPAPPPVAAAFAMRNKEADTATREGFAAKFPSVDVGRAHGVVEIQTGDGPEDLWIAPNDQGGQCGFIDFARDAPGPDGQFGFGGCDTSTRPASNINWGAVWVEPHPSLMTVYGHVLVDATRLELTLADGSTQSLPVIEGFFLASLDKGAKVRQLVAYDGAGAEVARENVP